MLQKEWKALNDSNTKSESFSIHPLAPTTQTFAYCQLMWLFLISEQFISIHDAFYTVRVEKKCFPEANFSFKSYQYVSHAESLNTKIEKKMLSKYLFFPFNPPSLLLPFDMDRKIWNNKKVMYEKNFSRIEENRYVAARIFNSWMRYESIPFKDFVLSRAGIHTNIHTKRAEHKRNEILKRSQRTRQMKLDEDSLFIRLKWRANRSF